MKYIKTYEANTQSIKIAINEYVICKEIDIGYNNKASKFFIENNIGKYIIYEKSNINNISYCIEFENVPEEFIYDDDFFKNPISGLKNVRWMKRKEILHHSKNKIDLEIKLSTSKYNL